MKQNLNAVQQMLADTDMLAYKLPVKSDETVYNIAINSQCDHVCSGDCRRTGCNCNCGEFHVSSTVDEMTEEELQNFESDRTSADYADSEPVTEF
jgi:hypothetical protein